MFKPPIHTAFAPNAENDDIALSRNLLLNPTHSTESVKNIKKWFESYTSGSVANTFSSGRAALYFAFKALNLPTKSEVLLQGFTCVAVPNAIVWAGLTPRLVDIDKNTLNISVSDLEKKISPQTRVVIVQHTFGIPAALERIMALANKHNLIIIEDCAHSLGAHYKGKPVGSYGDIAIYSFGRDKVVSSVFGGVTTTKNKVYATHLQSYEDRLITPPLLWILKQLFYTVLYPYSLPYYRVLIGKIMVKLASSFGFITPAVYPVEKKGVKPDFINYSLSPRLAHLAYFQLQKLDRFNRHRRSIAQIYQEALNLPDLVPGAIYLRYPLYAKDKQQLLAMAKKQHMYLGDWYSSIVYPATSRLMQNYKGTESCGTAKMCADHIINLPTHVHISESDAQAISMLLTQYKHLWK